jgi:hypothetical protein
MFANATGCDHIDDLLPQVQIEWHEVGPGFPANWRGVKVNLPEVVSSTQTNLPLEVILTGRTIDDGSPDQLALLLAFGVRRDGGRAAIPSNMIASRAPFFVFSSMMSAKQVAAWERSLWT